MNVITMICKMEFIQRLNILKEKLDMYGVTAQILAAAKIAGADSKSLLKSDICKQLSGRDKITAQRGPGLTNLVNKGYLNKTDKGGKTYYKLTSSGVAEFNRIKQAHSKESTQKPEDGSGPNPNCPKKEEIQTPANEADVNPKELEMGIKVEMEHTDDKAEAKEIALQHLAEVPDYYSKLAKHVESYIERLNILSESGDNWKVSGAQSNLTKDFPGDINGHINNSKGRKWLQSLGYTLIKDQRVFIYKIGQTPWIEDVLAKGGKFYAFKDWAGGSGYRGRVTGIKIVEVRRDPNNELKPKIKESVSEAANKLDFLTKYYGVKAVTAAAKNVYNKKPEELSDDETFQLMHKVAKNKRLLQEAVKVGDKVHCPSGFCKVTNINGNKVTVLSKSDGEAEYDMKQVAKESLSESTDLRCPMCGDNLGKDTENPKNAYCGNCGTSFKNPRGYKEKLEEKEMSYIERLQKISEKLNPTELKAVNSALHGVDRLFSFDWLGEDRLSQHPKYKDIRTAVDKIKTNLKDIAKDLGSRKESLSEAQTETRILRQLGEKEFDVIDDKGVLNKNVNNVARGKYQLKGVNSFYSLSRSDLVALNNLNVGQKFVHARVGPKNDLKVTFIRKESLSEGFSKGDVVSYKGKRGKINNVSGDKSVADIDWFDNSTKDTSLPVTALTKLKEFKPMKSEDETALLTGYNHLGKGVEELSDDFAIPVNEVKKILKKNGIKESFSSRLDRLSEAWIHDRRDVVAGKAFKKRWGDLSKDEKDQLVKKEPSLKGQESFSEASRISGLVDLNLLSAVKKNLSKIAIDLSNEAFDDKEIQNFLKKELRRFVGN